MNGTDGGAGTGGAARGPGSGAPEERGLPALLRRLIGADAANIVTGTIARGAAGTFGLRIITSVLLLAISLLLSRTLGAAGYGAYAYAIGWMQFLVVLSLLGLERLTVRQVAACRAQGKWATLRGLLRFSTVAVLAASLLFALLLVAWITLYHGLEAPLRRALWFALPMLPAFALLRLRASAVLGLERVARAQVPETLVQPGLFLAAAALSALLLGRRFNPDLAVLLMVGATLAGALWAMGLLRRYLPGEVRTVAPAYETRVWMASIPPLVFIGVMQATNARIDLLMLGAMRSASEAGVYTVANRGATLINYVLFAMNAAVAPAVAAMHARGERERLQRVLTRAARWTFLLSLPLAAALIFFRVPFLGLFGPEFVRGGPVLVILACAHLTVAVFGSVTPLLIMTGLERVAARAFAAGAVVNVTLNLVLIPRYGMVGAAAAMAVSMVLWNLLLALGAVRVLHLQPTLFGGKRREG